MALPQAKYREMVFQLLYADDLGKAEAGDMVALMSAELRVSRQEALRARKQVSAITERLDEIDAILARHSQSYDFHRIRAVERNVLRLGIYEIAFDEAIPPKVAISEAVRLTRKFSTKEAASFVNAVLDQYYKKSLGQNVDAAELKETIEELQQSEEHSQEVSKQVDEEE